MQKAKKYIQNILLLIFSVIITMRCSQYHTNHQENWNRIEKTVKGISDISKEENIKFIVALIPEIRQVDDLLWQDYSKKIRYNNINLRLPQDKFIEILNTLNVDYIDLLPAFQKMNKNNTFYFKIDYHWNEKGHELAAILIYEKLINNEVV